MRSIHLLLLLFIGLNAGAINEGVPPPVREIFDAPVFTGSGGEDDSEEPMGGRSGLNEPVEVNPERPVLLVGTTEPRGERAAVYVVQIKGPIDRTNLFILRRALKEAIRNDIEMIVLDMDTPGGRVDYTLEMMEMLARFEGVTATYVNNDAISAGSFIAAATNEIYFAPRGRIGASAVIMGGGQDIPETARLKIESYLRANLRSLTEDFRYRGDVIRAMMDVDFELEIDGVMIKPAGDLLTLTARESMQLFGDPPLPLLGSGIYESIEQMLEARWGDDRFEIRDFELTYSETLAKWMATFAPGLLGIGFLLLFIEFKTPGFGVFGALGITLMVVFFISNYIAGLAGNEVIVIFALGILLILIELLFFPGIVVLILTGSLMVVGSLLWAMIDYWPGGTFEFTLELLYEPLFTLVMGLGIAAFGAVIVAKVIPGSWFLDRLTLGTSLGSGDGLAVDAPGVEGHPADGLREGVIAVTATDLHPAGEIEYNGKRYSAAVGTGSIGRGQTVRVVGRRTYDWLVEEASDV